MQRLVFILILIVISNITSYSKAIDSIGHKSQELKMDSVVKALNERNEVIVRQNEILTTTLNAHSSIFSGLSTYFSIVSILLTIIVVILPLINYFFVLKPSRKAMKKVASLEKELLLKVEANFEHYLQKIEHDKGKELIKALNTGPKALTAFSNFFLLRTNTDFDSDDQETVIDFFEKSYEIDAID